MNRLLLFGVIIALSLISCNPALKRAASDMESSKETYKSCLIQNQDDTSKCDTLRAVYEVDVHNYKVIRDELY